MITFCSKLLVVISKIYCSKIYFVTYHLFIMLLSGDLLLNYKANHIKVCSYNYYRLQYYICCTFDPQFFSISISFLSKGQVSFCHHFASIVCPLSSYILTIISSPLKPNYSKFCGDGLWVIPFQTYVRPPSKMATVTKIENFFHCLLLLYCKSK